MPLLLLVSLIWAFSFGLIKGQLAGLDSTAVAVLRLVLALAVFLPFLRPAGLGAGRLLRLAGIGAVQFGLMYVLYQRSYAYLPAYAVVLFTLTTPLFIAGLDAVLERRWHARYLGAAALAIVGSAAVWYQATPTGRFGVGFLLVQLANVCFAAGQLAWRRERASLPPERTDASLFALPYAGAVLAAGLGSLWSTDWTAVHPTAAQWMVLGYLGVVASGACFFWWNVGAARVNIGTLAVFNNAKVPLGVACSLAFFGERADVPRLLVGGGLMGLAVWLAADRKR
ncbi:MAG: EamA family transporter [Verrucomicrobia bacterium]|nr:EamA family transporter [Verrucomicrobiota bacterium]